MSPTIVQANAITSEQNKMTEFELQLWRVFHGFLRWQEKCEKISNNTNISDNELIVLHIIGMNDRAKSINHIMRLLDSSGSDSIHYAIRKLLQKELVKKISTNKKASAYEVTEMGSRNIRAYTKVKKSILIKLIKEEITFAKLDDIGKTLSKLKILYDEADHIASHTHTKELATTT